MSPRLLPSGTPLFAAAMCAAALAAALALASAEPALAAGPQVKTQAPGYYRMMLGDFEITALNDGTFDMPADELLTHVRPGQVARSLQRAYLSLPVETSINAFLVNTGSKLVLVDAGSAGSMGPTTGRLVANLRAAGYQPEQVDEVYITHMHGDHVSGLVDGDKPVFPNAVVRADQRETGFWLSKEVAARAPADAKPYFENAMKSLAPYAAAGRLQPFDGETQLVPGIRAVPARGHTPGHTIYVVESQGHKLAVLGDLAHVAAVQLPDPSVTISFDLDAKAAAPSRKRVLADAAKSGYDVALAHFPFPGIGKLRAEGKGYVWVPANYSSRP